MSQGRTFRWLAVGALVLAIIVVPFLLFEDVLTQWTQAFLQGARERAFLTGAGVASLLASDILLPIPSSVVSTGGGLLLGFWGGLLASWVGMSVSCVFGYELGARAGRGISKKMLGAAEMQRLEQLNGKFGDWVILVARPIPVLAEASVLMAGIGRMRRSRFLVISLLSNAGVSAVYAAAGAFVPSAGNLLIGSSIALCVAMIGAVMAFVVGRKRR